MAKTKTNPVTIDDLMKLLQAGIAAVQAGQAVSDAMKVVDTDDEPAPTGFIIIKRENHTNQVFFSDHHPVDGIDTFGHSTQHTDRLVAEAFKYDSYDDAYDALMRLVDWDAGELDNDTLVGLGIYSVADDAIVFNMDIANPHNGAALPEKFWKD